MKSKNNATSHNVSTDSCFPTKRFSIKFVICPITLVAILIAIFLLLPKMSRLDWRSELIVRRTKLSGWAGQVKRFKNEKGKMPVSLYEASSTENTGPLWVKVRVGEDIYHRKDLLLGDSNRFFEEVEYALIAYRQGWFIMELKPGKYYQHRLMIDQAGKFWELREHKYKKIATDRVAEPSNKSETQK
jgi:hypothetical protein